MEINSAAAKHSWASNMLGCCLIFLHFLWGKLSTRTLLFQIIFFHALARFYIATKSISSIQHRKLWVEPAIVAKGGSEVADGDVGKVGGGEVVVAAAVVGGPAAPVKPALAAVEGVLVVVIVPVVLY